MAVTPEDVKVENLTLDEFVLHAEKEHEKWREAHRRGKEAQRARDNAHTLQSAREISQTVIDPGLAREELRAAEPGEA